jgi:hypothetical protein
MKVCIKEFIGTAIWYSMLAWMLIYWLVVHSWRASDGD